MAKNDLVNYLTFCYYSSEKLRYPSESANDNIFYRNFLLR